MIRGDIVWHKFKEPDKKRPVLILTRDSAIPALSMITVLPITTTIRDLNSYVVITEDDGMRESCAISVDSIQTVAKDKLGAYITHLSEDRMLEVFEAVKFAFGFDRA